MLLEKIVILGKLKILSKHHTSYDVLSDHLTDKGSLITSDLLSDNEHLLRSFVSVRDSATKAPHENYYHGFLNGIFSNCKDNLGEYHTNSEAGDGYADICFKDLTGSRACVIEIKVCSENESRIRKANEAIDQIIEKHYAELFLNNENITDIKAVGIAFSGKYCASALKG